MVAISKHHVLKLKKERGIMADGLQNNNLTNYAQEEKFRMQGRHWLRQSAPSPIIYSHSFEGSRGPTGTIPLVKSFVLLPMWSTGIRDNRNLRQQLTDLLSKAWASKLSRTSQTVVHLARRRSEALLKPTNKLMQVGTGPSFEMDILRSYVFCKCAR